MEESKEILTTNILLEELSMRALNVCKISGFVTAAQAIEYLKENKSFLGLKNCGANTNKELTNLCLKFGFELKPEADEIKESLEPYFQFRLNYLKPYLPHSLFKFLIVTAQVVLGKRGTVPSVLNTFSK